MMRRLLSPLLTEDIQAGPVERSRGLWRYLHIACSSGGAQVDSNGDGLVDLRELTTALSKWLALVAWPGSRDLLHPFATARDIALDFFIAMKQDPRRSAPSYPFARVPLCTIPTGKPTLPSLLSLPKGAMYHGSEMVFHLE